MERSIRRNDPLPFYVQLATILRQGIAEGAWSPGDLLPSEASLGNDYGLSRTAVRQALDVLVDEGLVAKEKGRGTFVRRRQAAALVANDVSGFFAELTSRGRQVETELLEVATGDVPPEIAPALRMSMGSRTIRLERIRRVDDQPVVVATTHLPADRFPGLEDADLTGSLYTLLQDRFGVRPRGGTRRFQAEAADLDVAAALGLAPGDPVLRVTALNVDQDGEPIEHFTAHYRGDIAAFDIRVGPAVADDEAAVDVALPTAAGLREAAEGTA